MKLIVNHDKGQVAFIIPEKFLTQGIEFVVQARYSGPVLQCKDRVVGKVHDVILVNKNMALSRDETFTIDAPANLSLDKINLVEKREPNGTNEKENNAP